MKEFNSQRCTSCEQSERLLALGLKKETADMRWANCMGNSSGTTYYLEAGTPYYDCDIPAWSLHRLIEMALKDVQLYGISFTSNKDAYEKVIGIIEYQIKEGYFNKEYLNGNN